MAVRATFRNVPLSVSMGRDHVWTPARMICLIAVLLIRGRIGIRARMARMAVVVVGGMTTMAMLMLSWRGIRRLLFTFFFHILYYVAYSCKYVNTVAEISCMVVFKKRQRQQCRVTRAVLPFVYESLLTSMYFACGPTRQEIL